MPTFNGPDWFSPRIPLFEKHLAEFVGKPDLHFLEVGSYEGRSALWMAENVLTGYGSRIDCVDTWEQHDEHDGVDMGVVFSAFRENVRSVNCSGRLFWNIGTLFHVVSREYVWGDIDFIYIDGSHHASDVLTDSAIAWQLLKVGGIMAWDDIGWRRDGSDWDHPATAVCAFLECFRDRVQVLSEPGDQQVWVRKVRP